MSIRYALRPADPTGHVGRFAIDLDGISGPSIDLVVPSWVPGSYHIVNYVRGFHAWSARAGPDGPPLPLERIDKARWRVTTGGVPRVRVEYSVYGHEAMNESFDLTPDHLFVNAAECLPYVDGHLEDPVEVALEVPNDWRVVSELPEIGSHPPVLRAPNYDTLLDNPIEIGRPEVLTIHPRGIPHRIVLCGRGNFEAHRLEEDIGKIVDAAIRLVGESPIPSYTFFYHLTELPDGGLEHASSTSCVFPRLAFTPGEPYRWFLFVTAHEYFHLYNVKRIRPAAFDRFDYTRENYTRLLWWMEGATDYFAAVILRRAGLLTPTQFLEEEAKMAARYLATPGRRFQSLEDSSLGTWVGLYQPYEDSPNRSISYYLKGHLVSLALDLELRERSDGRASLETVLRRLWEEYGRPGRGVGETELPAIVERATGVDVHDFFARFIGGTEDLDFDAIGRRAGLTFGEKPRPPTDEEPVPGYLGVRLEDAAGHARVQHVFLDAPGARGGLSPGDEIVAINGAKVTHAGFAKTMLGYPPGSPVELAVFRRGFLTRLSLTTGRPPPEKYAFTPVDAPSDLARRIYAEWIGAPWEPAKRKDA